MKHVLCLIIIGGLACPSVRAAYSFYALRDAYNANPANPQVYEYGDLNEFRTDTGANLITRTWGAHGFSSDIAMDDQGRFYLLAGDPSGTGDKTLWRWNSIADWASNTGATNLATRTGMGQVSGLSIHLGEIYIFSGNPNAAASKTLYKWSTAGDFDNESNAGANLGSRNTGAGIGFEIAPDGSVWFLDVGAANTSTSGTLHHWANITDFINNTGGSNNGGTFNFFGGADQIGGLAVIPEPSSLIMLVLGAATCFIRRRL